MDKKQIDTFLQSVEQELFKDIIPFWLKHGPDLQFGGFTGEMSNDLQVPSRPQKGLILNARLLWTFSALYRFTEDSSFLNMAERAFDYIFSHFWDEKYGGAFWLCDFKGKPQDEKKKTYGQAFLIYALAEYVMATNKLKALDQAKKLFELVEQHAFDKKNKGYIEAFERNWELGEDIRLSEKDMNEKKSMNTHLHLLEAYTHLCRVWKHKKVEQKLEELINIFLDHIIESTSFHFKLFFDETWQCKSDVISFGHDIEGTWLLCEAADILGKSSLTNKVHDRALKMTKAVYEQGLDRDGGLFYEARGQKIIDTDKHWWPQAEAAVGFLNAYELSGNIGYFDAAFKAWEFIDNVLVDKKYGEWFWRVSQDHKPYLEEPKISPWKGPYHNSRTCMELITRLHHIEKQQFLA